MAQNQPVATIQKLDIFNTQGPLQQTNVQGQTFNENQANNNDLFVQQLRFIEQSDDMFPVRGSQTSINFDNHRQSQANPNTQKKAENQMTEAQIEQKIRSITQATMIRTNKELNNKMDQKAKKIRDFVEAQMQKSQISIDGVKDDISRAHRNSMAESFSASMSMQQMQQSTLKNGAMQRQFQGEDVKSRALKKTLINDIRQTVVAERLQCKPIEGHDLPLTGLSRMQDDQMPQSELLQVENLETVNKQSTEMKQPDQILSFLLPTSLKQPEMKFLETSDITSIKTIPQAPKTSSQLIRDNYLEVLEKDKHEQNLPPDTREKTIKCLMKVMNHQLNGLKEQANDLDNHYKKTETEIDNYYKQLEKKDKSIKLKQLQHKFMKTKQLADDYHAIEEEEDNPTEQLADVAEILVDNKLLLGKIDKILDEDGVIVATDRDLDDVSEAGDRERQDTEIESLTDSLIDGMFKKYSKYPPKSRKQQASVLTSQNKPISTNRGSSQSKSKVTYSSYGVSNSQSQSRDVRASQSNRKFGNSISISHDQSDDICLISQTRNNVIDAEKRKQQKKDQILSKINRNQYAMQDEPTRQQSQGANNKQNIKNGRMTTDEMLDRELKTAMTDMQYMLNTAFN